jgi:hypothetical protein
MTTTLTRRRARERDRSQPTLFSQVVAPPPPAPPRETAVRVEAPPTVPTMPTVPDEPPREDPTPVTRTLDEAISALWGELSTGAAIDCPVCGSEMQPRHSAGHGVVGGRCGSCATTLA